MLFLLVSNRDKFVCRTYILTCLKVTFTLDCWSINEVAINGSNYMSPEAAASLSPQGVQQAIYGSKMTLVTEMLTLTTQWGLKGCLCLMYHRLTSVSPGHGPTTINTIADTLGLQVPAGQAQFSSQVHRCILSLLIRDYSGTLPRPVVPAFQPILGSAGGSLSVSLPSFLSRNNYH